MSYTPPPCEPGELDLDAVVRMVRSADVFAYVEQTGGGTATIYAGFRYTDAAGDERWAACAGPGWFLPDPDTGHPWAFGRARIDDFYVGPDDEDAAPTPAAVTNEAAAAAAIVQQVLAAPAAD